MYKLGMKTKSRIGGVLGLWVDNAFISKKQEIYAFLNANNYVKLDKNKNIIDVVGGLYRERLELNSLRQDFYSYRLGLNQQIYSAMAKKVNDQW
jgi:hypothetical protein